MKCLGSFPTGKRSQVALIVFYMVALKSEMRRARRGVRRISRVVLSLVLVASLRWPAGAEPVQPIWTSVGPEGGTITALAIDPQKPSTLYAGITDSRFEWSEGIPPAGKLFKTTDGGRSWRAMGADLPKAEILAIAIDPRAPATIYLSASPRRIFKSIDSGATWRDVGGAGAILTIDPQTPSTVYSGLFKSTEGGSSWRTITNGLPTDVAVTSMAIDPKTPTTLYVGLSSYRPARTRGVFKSTDGGQTWRSVGLTDAVVVALAIDPQTPTTLYAGTDGNYVFKSTDGGETWRPAREGLSIDNVYALAIDPQSPTILYAGYAGAGGGVHGTPGGHGVFKSTDGAGTWHSLDADPANSVVTALVIDPRTPSTVYMGTEVTGMFKSTDEGDNWRAINTGLPNLGIVPVAFDPQRSNVVYGLAAGVFKSTDGGGTWRAVNTGLPTIIVTDFVVDPRTPTTLYVGTNGSGVFKSTDGGASWHATPIPGPVQPGVTRLPIRYIAVLSLDPQTPTTVYAGGESSSDNAVSTSYVFKSTDGGESWRSFKISDTGVTLRKLRIDPKNPGTLYAVNIEAGIFKSTDGGENWRSVIGGLPLEENCHLPTTCLYVRDLAIDPRTPTTLYAAKFAGVFKSADGGANWSPVITGLTNLKVTSLAIDPRTPTTIYAGTYGGGVFKSTDGGGTWTPLNSGLIDLAVSSLAIDPVNPATIYATTFITYASGGVAIAGSVFVLRQ